MDPAVADTRRAVRTDLHHFDAGDLVLAAVSGGADSLALAAALRAESPALGLRAGAVTVDHGLQPGSAEHAERVAGCCRSLGLDPVVVQPVTVGHNGGPEAAARTARYAAMRAVADRLGARAVLLGHTLDDQAETVLLGLARGSGARSLAGMAATGDRVRRPFLALRRHITQAACAAQGLVPWDDPHNSDPSFTRVRVRDQVLPTMAAALGPGIPEALARSAELLRADADALDDWAAGVNDPLDVAVLAGLPTAVRTRVIRRCVIGAGAPAGSLTAAHVRSVERLVTDWHGQGGVWLPGGLVVERACDRLRFR